VLYKIDNEIKKRRERVSQFYYGDFGQNLRKKRLEMKMTQEQVSKGICSNTYLSKIENNQIVVNRDSLMLIMEKMDIPLNEICFPEEMLDYLDRSVRCFFYRDLEAYNELYKEVSIYQFSTLIQIIKLGYYILKYNLEEAGLIYNETFRYLSSLEDYGLSMFLLYASFYLIEVQDYKTARLIVEKIENHYQNDDLVFSMLNYAKYIIYGNLYIHTQASEYGFIALNLFNRYSNMERLTELYMWKDIFLIYEAKRPVDLNANTINFLPIQYQNRYLLLLAISGHNPKYYFKKLNKEGTYYLEALFFKAYYFMQEKDYENYQVCLEEINALHYQLESKVDYTYLLKIIKAKNEMLIKDYLINYILPFFLEKQELYFYNLTIKEIVKILTKKKRYKDALTYKTKTEETINVLQTT
jgi:transcriptional regulator with XRE-family HTH domain